MSFAGLCRAGVLATLLLLAGCAGHGMTRHRGSGHGAAGRGWSDNLDLPQDERYRDRSDSIPSGPPPDVSKIPEPVPKYEPRSLYGNKSPYTVLGQTYHVLPTARGYDERGIASYYGSKFDRYKTSNLEDYDMYKFSAASKVLPLPSYARVTNLQNGKSVIVRINDRGPFAENRIIDLSYVAAVKIGIWPKGTGLVEVQGIAPGEPVSELPRPRPSSRPGAVGPGIYLQVGAFGEAANAERVAAQLRAENFAPVYVIEAVVNGRAVHRVRVGPLKDVETADDVTARIERMGLPRPQVAVD